MGPTCKVVKGVIEAWRRVLKVLMGSITTLTRRGRPWAAVTNTTSATSTAWAATDLSLETTIVGTREGGGREGGRLCSLTHGIYLSVSPRHHPKLSQHPIYVHRGIAAYMPSQLSKTTFGVIYIWSPKHNFY